LAHTHLSETQNDPLPPFSAQLGPLFFLASIFYLNFVSRIIMAPLMPTIENDLGISHGEAGSLFLLISLGYFPGLIGSGFISSRLTHRKTIVLSSAALGAALLFISQCRALGAVLAGVTFLGLVAGLYLPSGIATLTALVHSKHWGKAIAIHELGPNLSFLTAPLIAEALLKWFSWRGVLALLGIVAICLGIAFWRYGRGGASLGEAPRVASIKALFSSRGFWIMSFLFGLGISGTLGIYTMLTLFLVVERGLEQNWANMLIAISRIACPAMVFLAGWSTDRLGVRGTLLGVFVLTGFATILLGFARGPWLIAVVIVQPLLAASFFPAGFAALSMAVPSTLRNVAVSITVPFGFVLGGGVSPLLIGLAGDAGVFALGIILVGILILAGGLISRYLIYS